MMAAAAADVSAARDAYAKANEMFVEDDLEEALDMYVDLFVLIVLMSAPVAVLPPPPHFHSDTFCVRTSDPPYCNLSGMKQR